MLLLRFKLKCGHSYQKSEVIDSDMHRLNAFLKSGKTKMLAFEARGESDKKERREDEKGDRGEVGMVCVCVCKGGGGEFVVFAIA